MCGSDIAGTQFWRALLASQIYNNTNTQNTTTNSIYLQWWKGWRYKCERGERRSDGESSDRREVSHWVLGFYHHTWSEVGAFCPHAFATTGVVVIIHNTFIHQSSSRKTLNTASFERSWHCIDLWKQASKFLHTKAILRVGIYHLTDTSNISRSCWDCAALCLFRAAHIV